MNRREKTLLAVVAGILAYFGLDWFVTNKIAEPLETKRGQIASLADDIEAKRKEVYAAREAQYELNQWRAAALPADVNRAQTLYQEFLRELIDRAGIERPSITPAPVPPVRGGEHFIRLPFNVRVRAKLDQMTGLLHGFYQSGLFHEVRMLKLVPVVTDGRLKEFDATLDIEAVSMPDAVAKDKLPFADGWPREGSLEAPDRFELIVAKNVFQPTQLVERERPRPVAKARDERGNYKVTGAYAKDGGGSALWLKNTKTSKRIRVNRGEEIDVNGMRATVVKAVPEEILLKVDEKIGRVRLGSTLDEWQQVESEPRSE